MTPERWSAIEQVFHAAAALPPARQHEYVLQACGNDEELQREVLSLLAHADLKNDIRAAVAGAASALVEDSAEFWVGRVLGPYRLSAVIGRGGMGVVYSATRADQHFRKEVAIKLVKRGLDTDTVLQKFRTERQILAQLDHPFIARLLDGGATPDGRPYLVMERVEGVPITRYCEDGNLPVEERLRLFSKVCEAVLYAHRNLVVHRDLKPGNILITAEGIPRLLDFGVAKLLSHNAEEGPVTVTSLADRALTPDYASPEQVSGQRVTTATDIYSLGAILYELLSGQRPHRLEDYSPAEIEASICRGALRPPSAAVAHDPRRARPLHGDLDNIVLMAMRKEPERRYLSAGQFAEDIERYLSGRPVIARPDTALYRLTKFVHRNRIAVAAAALAATGLTAGGIFAAHQAQRAEQRFQQVRSLAKVFLFDLHNELQELPGATRVRRFAVNTGLDYLKALERESAGDPELMRELASAYRRLGDVQGYPLASNLGDGAGAEKSYREAIRILEATAGADVEMSEVRRRLGELLDHRGDAAGAVENYRQGLASAASALTRKPGDFEALRTQGTLRTSYGRTLYRMGDVQGLAREASLAAQTFETLTARRPGDGSIEDSLATSYRLAATALESSGKWEQAFPYYLKNVEVRRKRVALEPDNVGLRRQLMLAHSFVGDFLVHQLATPYDPARAIESYRAMLAIAQAQARQDPTDQKARMDYALSLLRMGKAFLLTGDPASSLDHLRQSQKLTRSLLERQPRSFTLRQNLAFLEERIAHVLSALHRLPEALSVSSQSIRTAEQLVKDDPQRAETLSAALASYRTHLNLAVQSGQTTTVQTVIRRLKELCAKAEALHSSEPGLVSNLAQSFASIAASMEQQHNSSAACEWIRKSAQSWDQLRAQGHKGVVIAREYPTVARKLTSCL